ncbi:hypothetical protein [Saccharothrix australiensis]|uniref:hypothetical protein n=1 Tax=Saccharothrix australiensis TaxID=2072 RepID=UPI001B864615|nr:hypothetical protein [Saccharothrix australiensis]
MSTAKAGKKPRERGEIEELPSGSLRVKVYAGIDPLTGRRLYLTETVPPGKSARKTAEKARIRFINQVDEQRNPKTKANVNRLMDRVNIRLDFILTQAAKPVAIRTAGGAHPFVIAHRRRPPRRRELK